MDPAAQAAAQQADNRQLNKTILELPKFYGTSKDTVSAENLIDRIDASIATLTWTQPMAFNYFRMALHSDAEMWLKLIRDTEEGFQDQWDFIKPLFKARFGKKMDVAKIGQVLDNLNEQVSQFAAKMNTNFSQLCDIIPMGKVVNVPSALDKRTDAVCAGIHNNAIQHTHLQYLKYFFIAGLPKAIMQLVASKDPATISEAHKEAVKIQDLTKTKGEQGWSSVDSNESVIKFKATGPKIRTVETIAAVVDVAEVPLEVHLVDVEVTMVTTATATANQRGTTNSKMVRNQHAGGATSMDTVKKTAANESRPTLHAKASMDRPTGLNRKPHQ